MNFCDEKPIEGWKAIAAYFGRSIKTVQRWKSKRLPVHKDELLGIVAYPSELEAWRRSFEAGLTDADAGNCPASATQPKGQSIPTAPSVSDLPTGHPVRTDAPRLWQTHIGALMLGTVLLVLAASILLGVGSGRATSVASTPLTHDGYPKRAPLWPVGTRIYFVEYIDGTQYFAWVDAGGGEVARVVIPGVRLPVILDVREPGPEVLLFGRSAEGRGYLWRWVVGRTPERLMENQGAIGGCWLRGGDSFALAADDGSLRLIDARRRERVFHVPGLAHFPRWSASRNLLRFSVFNPAENSRSIWEINGIDGTPRPVSTLPVGSYGGNWGADTRVFAFTAGMGNAREVWSLWEGQSSGRVWSTRVQRVAGGSPDYAWASPATDGRFVFALTRYERAELVRYDAPNLKFIPYLEGVAAVEVDYSRDGKWLAYSKYPERTLWKSSTDGATTQQLTTLPLAVSEPHWSPDGKTIAFMGQYPGRQRGIWLVSANGGSIREAFSTGEPQGVPTWSADGLEIAFGDIFSNDRKNSMRVHVLDLRTHTITDLAAAQSLWSPRWSPDGRCIAALSSDSTTLMLYSVRSRFWREVTRFYNIDYVDWTADAAYIHFRGVLDRTRQGQGYVKGLYRVHVPTLRLEFVADLDRFDFPTFEWFGVMPDGTPIGTRGVNLDDLYGLQWR